MTADEKPDRYAEIATASRVSSGDYREKAAKYEELFHDAHRRLAATLRAVDTLFGPAASEVLRRLFDDVGENAGEAIDNLQYHAGVLRAELEDRRLREVHDLRARASELAVANARLVAAGRRLASELELVASGARRVSGPRDALRSWRAEDPQ